MLVFVQKGLVCKALMHDFGLSGLPHNVACLVPNIVYLLIKKTTRQKHIIVYSMQLICHWNVWISVSNLHSKDEYKAEERIAQQCLNIGWKSG